MKNDLSGKTIGAFFVIRDSGKRRVTKNGNSKGSGCILWTVRCPYCQKEIDIEKQQILKYKSCGCKHDDILSNSLRKSLNAGGYGEIYATHWTAIKKNARQRNLPFEIDAKYAWELFLSQDRKCALTGEVLVFSNRCYPKGITTASLDRIDSSGGYTQGNVQWVHKNINMMKQQYSTKLFIDWCKKVYQYNQPKS